MLKLIVRNRTVQSLNRVYLKNKFKNQIFDKYVKTGFSIK